MVRKFVSIIAAFAIIFSALPAFTVNAFAAGYSEKEFYDYLYECVERFDKDIDISYYAGLAKWKLNDVKNAITKFFYESPELFYINNKSMQIAHIESMGYYHIKYEYPYTKEKVRKMQLDMEAAAKNVIAGITDDMTDVEKALYVHDYLILNNAYDHSHKRYSAYDCLVTGSSVCQGYSLAYEYIMRDLLGIDCSVVISDSENHSWNYIKIGDSWYHVDLTMDDLYFTMYKDKNYDGFGEVYHDNFLLSDAAIKKTTTAHRKWDTLGRPAAKNTKYDKSFWRDINGAMTYYDGQWYYAIDDQKSPGINHKKNSRDFYITTSVCSYDFDTGKTKTLDTFDCEWLRVRNEKTGELIPKNKVGWYTRSFVKVAIVNNCVYYNTPDKIFRADLSDGTVKSVYTLKKSGNKIYSILAVSGNKLRICYKPDLTYSDKFINLKLA